MHLTFVWSPHARGNPGPSSLKAAPGGSIPESGVEAPDQDATGASGDLGPARLTLRDAPCVALEQSPAAPG